MRELARVNQPGNALDKRRDMCRHAGIAPRGVKDPSTGGAIIIDLNMECAFGLPDGGCEAERQLVFVRLCESEACLLQVRDDGRLAGLRRGKGSRYLLRCEITMGGDGMRTRHAIDIVLEHLLVSEPETHQHLYGGMGVGRP